MAEPKIFDKFKYGNDTFIVQDNVSGYITSTAVATALDNKVDKVSGKGLSTNDYTTAEKNKLAGIDAGAEVNVQADWNQTTTTADDYIKNKPTIPTVPTNVGAFTNDVGYLTSADVPEGASAYTGTISPVGTSANSGIVNGFARGDHVHNLTLGTLDSTLVYNLGVIYPNDNMVFEVSSAAFNAIQAMWDTGFCIIKVDINSDADVYAIKERLISYNDMTLYAFVGVEASMGNQGLETGKHLFGISSSGFGLYTYVSDWNQDDTETVFNTQLAHLNISSSTTGITATTDATKTTLGTASSIYGVQSSTTTASKVTLSGSNSFSASVSNHVLSFSHGAQTVSASDVTVPIKNASATSIPNVSVASATVTITDSGHTHQLSN